MSSLQSSKKAPRVLIATLFLPETVSFEDPGARQQQEHQQQLRLLQEHNASIIERNGARTPQPPSAGTAALSSDADNVPFPSFPRGPQISFPPEELKGDHVRVGSRPVLSTIHSGTSTPTRSATPPPQGSENGNTRSSLSWSTSSMPEHGRKPRMPQMQRAGSILEDLQARGAGITPAAGPLTPGTGELDLGTNPFENAASPSSSFTPGHITPSLQSSIASARRPTGSRLTVDGGAAPQASLNQALKDRLGRLQAANSAARTPESFIDSTQRTGRTPGALPPGSGVSQVPAQPEEGTGSYFSSTAGDPSPATPAGSSPAPSSSTHRRRSSSSNRHGSISGVEKPGLNRAFTRSRRTTDARRRSSTSIDGAHMFPPGSPGGELPSFTFEHNPHGNGGLQNAIRSISASNLRTASEPTRSTIDAGTETISRQLPAPTAKSVMGDHVWIGTPGCSIDDLDAPLRDSIEKRYLQDKRSAVVWVDDDVLEPAYDMFCKQILWPTFHYQILDAHKSKAYESPSWLDYKAMNQAIADKIVAMYRPGDLVWVNDYHLLLVPRMVRNKLPHVTIGFFLHINFPSSEIFRCLPVRQELLDGVLGADLVGFQTYNLARHFRQTCQRLLSVEATPRGIQLANGFTRVGVFSIGIDVRALNQRKREAEVAEWLTTLKDRYAGFKVLIARDKLDEIKGVRKKLQAYECFLEMFPEWQGKVVLIQVAMATSEENEKQGEVMDVVSRINARFSTFTYQPVVFLHQDVSFSQYLALLQVADCFINASLREGMNLTSHEFVICQESRWAPLILSEFTGSYSKAGFHRSIAINPYDKLAFARAINEALTMPESERISRWQDLERHVWAQTAQQWCTSFLESLSKGAPDVLARPQASPRLPGSTDLSPELDVQEALAVYKTCSKRLILLDLEGTLVHIKQRLTRRLTGHGHALMEQSLQGLDTHLKRLAGDPQNTVYVMSGAPPTELDDLAKQYPSIGWIAENGCFVSLPERQASACANGRTWHKLVSGIHESWRQPVLEILRYYTERTPGSVVDDRGISIVWRYANTEEGPAENNRGTSIEKRKDDEMQTESEMPIYKDGVGNEAYHWARRQAAEVQNHIMDSLGERFGIQLYPGATSFLILPKKAGRATAVAHILQSDETPGEELGEPPAADYDKSSQQPDDDENREATRERDDDAASTEERLTSDVDNKLATHQLLEQYDYVLTLTEDQRLCSWLEEMALDKIVTVSVGEKRRGTRWRISDRNDVQNVLKAFADCAGPA